MLAPAALDETDWIVVKPVPGVKVGVVPPLGIHTAMRPSRKSLGVEVDTVTDAVPLFPVAVLGLVTFGSNGHDVFAPLTPNAVIVILVDPPVKVAVITVDERAELAMANHASPMTLPALTTVPLRAKVRPIAVTELTVGPLSLTVTKT